MKETLRHKYKQAMRFVKDDSVKLAIAVKLLDDNAVRLQRLRAKLSSFVGKIQAQKIERGEA